jgi:hypothetical protein
VMSTPPTCPDLSADLVTDFVVDAISNKYQDAPESVLAARSRQYFDSYLPVHAESELLARLRPLQGFEDDISNQVLVLLLIERHWRLQAPQDPLRSLHAAAFGISRTERRLRSSETVADYDGPLPHVEHVGVLLQELELLVERLVPVLAGAPARSQATFLAHLLSSIIRIHPFEDGNGRVARLCVQLCSRTWGRPFMVLPKVRNDSTWLASLSAAVHDNNMVALTGFFFDRLETPSFEAPTG